MKSLLALLAGAIISTHAVAANQVAVELSLGSNDGYPWESGSVVTYASISYTYPDGRGVYFASHDNVPRVTPDGQLEYPDDFGAVTGPAFVQLTMPDDATGGIWGYGSTWLMSYLLMPQTSLTVSGVLSASHLLDHDGEASYRAELSTSDSLGNGSSLLEMEQTFTSGSSNLVQSFSYTFYNDSDDYRVQFFNLYATAAVSGATAPIPEPTTYATMLLGLAALIPATRATRRKRRQ